MTFWATLASDVEQCRASHGSLATLAAIHRASARHCCIPATHVLEFSAYQKEQRKSHQKLRWLKVTRKHPAPLLRGASYNPDTRRHCCSVSRSH
jgi:hypothetical protein